MYQDVSVLPLLNEEPYVMECEMCPNRNGSRKLSLKLFDRNGKDIATKLRGWLTHNSYFGPFIERILLSPNCFTLTTSVCAYNGTHHTNIHFFETLYVVERKPAQQREYGCSPYDHSLTNEMLYTIKYFQLTYGSDDEGWNPQKFQLGYNIYKLHPDLFTKCDTVDSEQLDKLRIGLENKEIILEKKEIEIIIEKSSMMAERTKLMEEKRSLFMVKQKLDLMKRELDMERDAFEKEKREHEIKNIDLDDYFELPIAEIVSPTIAESILFTSQPFADL